MVDMWEHQADSLALAAQITGHSGREPYWCTSCAHNWPCPTVEAAQEAIFKDRQDTVRAVRSVVTQYVATAEQWRYDRMVWAFALMLEEIPQDTPEPRSPADD